MNFSTNQVMQFYVSDKAVKSVVTVGKKFKDGSFSLNVSKDDAGKEPILRTDKIENVMWVKKATTDQFATPTVEAFVALDAAVNGGAPIVGQDYIVRVSYPTVNQGIEAWTTKTAAAHVVDATTDVIEELAKNLNDALAADGILKAEAVEAGLVIYQDIDLAMEIFEPGVRPVEAIQFDVVTNRVIFEGEERDWASVEKGEGAVISGAYKLADMEYFAMGERGDEYRMIGWPNNAFKPKSKIDVSKTYTVYTIHYAAVGANANHKMEKEMVIAATGTIDDLETALTALGAVIETPVVSA